MKQKPGQAEFFFAERSANFRVGRGAVEKAVQLRLKAEQLQARVSRGEYDTADLAQFWQIANSAPKVLMINTSELSERAGLGSNYFSSMAKSRRSPKLHNLLKALSAVLEVANERLVDESSTRNFKAAQWIQNPLSTDQARLEKIQADLLTLVGQLRSSNSLSDNPDIDVYWRNSLIDLLETTISVLKSPMVETGLLAKTGSSLVELAQKVGNDARSGFVGALAGATAATLLQIAGTVIG